MRETRYRWQNFVVYYGYSLEDVLVQFDLVIVEARAHGLALPRRLQHQGRVPVAYVSVLEQPRDGEGMARLWSLYGLGVSRGWRPDWTVNYLMDIRQREWRDVLVREVERLLLLGYAGVFLDTVGVCQMPGLDALSPGLVDELTEASAVLIHCLRRRFPKAILIQNGGLNKLIRLTVPAIDAVCWEDFRLELAQGSKVNPWSGHKVQELRQYAQVWGLKVLLLAGLNPEENNYQDQDRELKAMAAQNGFLAYTAPIEYVSGIFDLDGRWVVRRF